MAHKRKNDMWTVRTLISDELREQLRRAYPQYYESVRIRMALTEWAKRREEQELTAADRDAKQIDLYRAYLAERMTQ